MRTLAFAVGLVAACGSHAAPIGNGGSNTGGGSNSGGGRDVAVNPAACAASYAAIPAGQACDAIDARCAYAEGRCSCGPQSYCGGIEPSPETVAALERPVWQCTAARTDGCPEQAPQGACTQPGKQCVYGTCCTQVMTCTDGTWVGGPPQCPP